METFWGGITGAGSISNLREKVNHTQLDKTAKTFSIADEFVLYMLKAHLLASVHTMFGISGSDDEVEQEVSAA